MQEEYKCSLRTKIQNSNLWKGKSRFPFLEGSFSGEKSLSMLLVWYLQTAEFEITYLSIYIRIVTKILALWCQVAAEVSYVRRSKGNDGFGFFPT